MRTPSRISPSALARFEKDRESYYLTYCAEPRTPRPPQSKPASVGSAFDAFVKGRLMKDIFGNDMTEELFETQVEDHVKDFAREAGQYCMEQYEASGAYQDLIDLLEGAQGEPQFEFDSEIVLEGDLHIAGKPDCQFIHRDGAHIILDWKINGYCSKSAVSPSPGFAICRDGSGWKKPSRSNGDSHRLYKPVEFMGLDVNEYYMEKISIDWADQLAMYGWMAGEPVGSQNMVCIIEQGVCKNNGDKPLMRFASHVTRVSVEHQKELYQRLLTMREALNNQWIFDEMSKDGSLKRCQQLDAMARSMQSDGTPEGDFFAKCAKPTYTYKGR
jgi:hypothetical protein